MLEHERKIREIVYQQRELKRQEEQRKKEEFKKNFPELAKEKEEREERERQKKLLELQKASRLQHEQWQEELRLGKIKIEFLTQKNNSNTKKSNLETTMSYIDSLTGYEFEEYIANLLKNLGYYNVKVTPGSGDKGVDIFAEKNITNYAFQCKLNRHNNIGPDAVQEIFSGKTFYEKRNNKKISGIVVTNSFFSKNATEMANELDIVLWDRDKLIDLIKETQ